MFVVFDLDGTLADIEHRRHFVADDREDGPDWDAFFGACFDDTPKHEVISALTAMLAAGHRVEIWSGRSDAVAIPTLQWLAQHGVDMNKVGIRMRQRYDYTPDEALKRSWIYHYGRPDIVFDDRDKVVAMWREEGVTCCQVAPGDF